MSRMSRGSLLDKRRPLRTTALTSAALDKEICFLQDTPNHFIEFDVKYLGEIPGVPGDTDTTNRTEVLKIIDRGKKQGLVPLQVTLDQDAILYLSTEIIRITRRDPPEEDLHQFQLHEIAQVCYVAEEGQHILAVTHGTPDILNMTVLLCDSQELADGVTSIWSYCFHLVYTEAMVELIEETIDMVIQEQPRPSGSDSTIDDVVSVSESSTQASERASILRDYMWHLKTKLKVEELIQFSQFWKTWNYSSNKLQEFCDNLLTLFGPERTYLLSRLFPFIPAEDTWKFEAFLKKQDINLPEHGTLSSHHGYPAFYTRSISDVSINSNTATSNGADLSARDLDSELDSMGRTFERIEQSVGDTVLSYLPQPGAYDRPSQDTLIYDRNTKA
ncbi:cerebral cavernous malformations protein 2 homolog [Mya arenaria]|uniref:cerebral cavernous malformations protein 2 homolog n=1 Tax=Mya arenaria TaxID=6604 RepID=UPI0022DF5D1D|nr:cerebral cavernous malformations protein 2 homolog [Mya arenaria]XP_052776579.1 cerebral cavernous malformations protein 2 homolog [Mya arenaria]